jgi:hypothetical protein
MTSTFNSHIATNTAVTRAGVWTAAPAFGGADARAGRRTVTAAGSGMIAGSTTHAAAQGRNVNVLAARGAG